MCGSLYIFSNSETNAPCLLVSSAACSGSSNSCFVLEGFGLVQSFICFLFFYQIIYLIHFRE